MIQDRTAALSDKFRSSMRSAPGGIALIAARDGQGRNHGMAVTSAVSLSMAPPAMMVAVNKSASISPVIDETGRFSLNWVSEAHLEVLECFSRSDRRAQRFAGQDWTVSDCGLPVLSGALSVHLCTVAAAHGYGTHTVFFGRVDDVVLPGRDAAEVLPPVWLNGAVVPLAR